MKAPSRCGSGSRLKEPSPTNARLRCHSATGRESRQLKAAAAGRPFPPATSFVLNRIGMAWTASKQVREGGRGGGVNQSVHSADGHAGGDSLSRTAHNEWSEQKPGRPSGSRHVLRLLVLTIPNIDPFLRAQLGVSLPVSKRVRERRPHSRPPR